MYKTSTQFRPKPLQVVVYHYGEINFLGKKQSNWIGREAMLAALILMHIGIVKSFHLMYI